MFAETDSSDCPSESEFAHVNMSPSSEIKNLRILILTNYRNHRIIES